jgi:hypothetical protein
MQAEATLCKWISKRNGKFNANLSFFNVLLTLRLPRCLLSVLADSAAMTICICEDGRGTFKLDSLHLHFIWLR